MSDTKNSILPDIIEPMSNASRRIFRKQQDRQMEPYLLLLVFLIMLFCIL